MEIGFFLKKFISFFVEPYGMVLALFAIGLLFLFFKKNTKAKVFLVLSFAVLFLYSYPPFSNYLVSNLENKYHKYDYKQNVKYIHVLGSGHNDDNSQPISSRAGTVGAIRVLEGVVIYNQIANSKLIFTGYGGGSNITDAQMHANLAIALGVDKKDIIINGTPKDTKEEAIFTKSLLGSEPFILVTSATHMPRAMKLFKSMGTNPIPAPTNFYKNDIRGYLRAPDLGCLNSSQMAIHEYLGILWNKIRS